jgi:hypothetical protein
VPRNHRLELNGQRLSYTCANARFRTNIKKGSPHRSDSGHRGSVFSEPLAQSDGYSLWLEHVIDHRSSDEYYWLMWYDPAGLPTIPLSGILSRDEVANMQRLFASFIP